MFRTFSGMGGRKGLGLEAEDVTQWPSAFHVHEALASVPNGRTPQKASIIVRETGL